MKQTNLARRMEQHGTTAQRLFSATDAGYKALVIAHGKARELFGELVEENGRERRTPTSLLP